MRGARPYMGMRILKRYRSKIMFTHLFFGEEHDGEIRKLLSAFIAICFYLLLEM